MELDVEISCSATFYTFTAARHPNHLTILYAGRNGDVNFFLTFGDAIPMTCLTRSLGYFALTITGRADAGGGEVTEEGVACLAQFTLTIAGLTSGHFRTFLRSRATTNFTGRHL